MRCDDCMDSLGDYCRVFVVLKKTRDLPPDVDPTEARQLEGLCYDQVFICADCAGWYRDAIEVTGDVHV